MTKQRGSILIKLIALILVFSFVSPCIAFATASGTIQPYASKYLSLYNTYIADMGNGDIQIWFEVMGTDDMDEIGTLSIDLYEVNANGSLTFVKSFLHENNDSMLSYNDWYHYSYVSYQGSSSKTYKAYVCIWAGKNGSGDTRYMWATE